MTKRLDIIMLALPRWDGAYSSTAFSLAKEFSKYNRVFYIDNPFTIKDFISDFRTDRIQSRKTSLLFGNKNCRKIDGLSDNLTIVTPRLTIPINFLSAGVLYEKLSAWNDSIIFQTIKDLMQEYSIQQFIFINSFNPFYFRQFPGFFKPALNIYHAVDDINNSKYVNKHGPRLENEAIKKADITFTTSRELKRLKSAFSNHIYYLPNAADATLFKQSLTGRFPVPKEIEQVTKPIVIYTGHIDYRIDYDLLKFALRAHPDKLFLMVGPLSIKKGLQEELNTYSNILFTGRKDISELPAYLHYSRCSIIPFTCNTLTKSIYPLKVNEYLAAGKPVVSTAFSEDILDFKNIIRVASTHEDFSNGISTAIETDSEEKALLRVKVAEGNTWEARINLFWEIVGGYLNKSA